MIDDKLLYTVSDMRRILANLAQVGTVTEIRQSHTLQARVKIHDLETDFLPVIARRAHNDNDQWPLDVGEQVLVLAPMGDMDLAIIVGSVPYGTVKDSGDVEGYKEKKHTVSYEDGAVFEYDKKTHAARLSLPEGSTLKIEVAGAIEGTSKTLNFTVKDQTTVTHENEMKLKNKGITMNVEGTANIMVTGDAKITAKTIKLNSEGTPGDGVVTQKCVCSLTGNAHPMASTVVYAGVEPTGGGQ